MDLSLDLLIFLSFFLPLCLDLLLLLDEDEEDEEDEEDVDRLRFFFFEPMARKLNKSGHNTR